MDDRLELVAAMRSLRVIALALAGSVVLFAVVSTFLIVGIAFAPLAELATLPIMIGVATLVGLALVAAPAARRALGAGPAGESRIAASERYARAWMLSQAIREAAGLFGVWAGLLAGSVEWTLAFAASSVTAQLLSLPREGELRAALRRARPDEEPQAPDREN